MAHQYEIGSDKFTFGVIEVSGAGGAGTFCTVLSSDVEHKVDEHVFEKENGDAAAVLLHNHTLEVQITGLIRSDATSLVIGAQVVIPGLSIKANVVNIKRSMKNKDGAQITFTAKHWMSIGDSVATTV